MKLFLWQNPPEKLTAIHGVDYQKGVPPEGCGKTHQFRTRNCKPIYITEVELRDFNDKEKEDFVEIVHWRLP